METNSTTNNIKNKNLRDRAKELFAYMAKSSVGYDNRISAKQIIAHFNSDTSVYPDKLGLFKTRQDVEETILWLRKHLNRKIGSSTSGYWLMCSDDKVDGLKYITNQALGKLKTAIECGVNPRLFYSVLNVEKPLCNNVANNQTTLEDDEEVKRYSDDLQDIEERIFQIDMCDRWLPEDEEAHDYQISKRNEIIEKDINKYIMGE